MNKFNMGDIVTYPRAYMDIHRGKLEVIGLPEKPGGDYYVKQIEKGDWDFYLGEDGMELVEALVQEGQIYVCTENKDEFKVLAVGGELIAVSQNNCFDKFDQWYAKEEFKKELLDSGYWHLKGAKDEVKEVTLSEIAEKFNVAADKIRVKKED